MSSKSPDRTTFEAWLVLVCMVLATLWYGSNQFLYSLYFIYQVVRILLPGIVPDIRTP
jgi:hypothetical protein